ncbi:MAG TPA: hypothetical protein VGM30_13305 [Puia sp.]|jgi:hypothetical protein
MSSRLEQFILDHREEFDGEEPDKKIWEKIREDMEPEKKKPAPTVRIYTIRWSAAAAVLLVMAGAAWYFNARTNHSDQPGIASQLTHPDTSTKNPDQGAQTPTAGQPSETTATTTGKPAGTNPSSVAGTNPKEDPDNNSLESSMNEEMYHYARLVEIKHKELKTIEKDEPLLYRQFASDVNKLDSVYRNLQEQLPTNPNREQLLEAMLQNLQLQMGLLNHQLDIIKQINHSKKTTYEKAYKTA